MKPRAKHCQFCALRISPDYKSVEILRVFLHKMVRNKRGEEVWIWKGKIQPRRTTGNCRAHQAQLARAIKNAREMALLPYQ